MNLRQKQFVEEYVIDLNAKQAAIRAGYSERTAESQGSRLLSNVKVSAAIQKAVEERSERTQIDADYVLRQAAKLHERCMQEVEPLTDRKGDQIKDDEGRPIYEFDANGAARSLELIGKHVDVMAFKERTEWTGPNGGPIQVANATLTQDQALELLKANGVS